MPADLLLTNSNFMLERIGRTFHFAKRLGVLSYSIDADAFRPSAERRRRFRQRWGLEENTIAVGIVGFVDTWKGQDIFLQAAKILGQRRSPIRMLVIGGPRDGNSAGRCAAVERRLHEYTRDNDLSELVLFTGNVDVTQGALDGLDIVVHASTEPEPFGMAILEAMAKEKPVIASDEGGPREIVTSGVDGLLVAPRLPMVLAEAISQLCEDRRLRDKLAHSARETAVTRFNPETSAAVLEQWYYSLV